MKKQPKAKVAAVPATPAAQLTKEVGLIPITPNFNKEVDLRSISDHPDDQHAYDLSLGDLFVRYCNDAEAIGCTVKLFSCNEKLIDILRKHKSFKQDEVPTASGLYVAGLLWYKGNKHVMVTANEYIAGGRLVTDRGIVTFYFDGLKSLAV